MYGFHGNALKQIEIGHPDSCS